jgi:hypothetical protein
MRKLLLANICASQNLRKFIFNYSKKLDLLSFAGIKTTQHPVQEFVPFSKNPHLTASSVLEGRILKIILDFVAFACTWLLKISD